MPVHIETTLPHVDIPKAQIARIARRVLRREGRGHATVTIIFVDDAFIRQLNHEYRHLNRATDVLSFILDDGETPDQDIWGEVYVSIYRAREQAVRYHVALDDEINRLVVHGCLHILGYDHHRSAERRVMRQKEALYLEEAGTGSSSDG
ncbi:MAG: rRNA maturation RNase YbeY [Gemmatimonadota bacterium]|nr:rRNA maturation RNase YbeY [Gemmatimonadota bacterium]